MHRTLLIITLLASSLALNAQSCFNVGFEDSSFVNWTGYTGIYTDSLANMTIGIVPGRHKIISAYPTIPYDSLADTVISKVAPGSNFSVRLGNSSVGRQHDKLLYEIDVDSNNLIFSYASAVVLQNPGHTMLDQPFFQIKLIDTAGNELDTVCGKITIFSDPSIPGFVPSAINSSILYRDWTFAGIDLTPYYGQTVIVEFTTKDCDLGGHYGYAYIDASCYPKQIITQFCEGSTDSIRMTAPDGFEYQWNTGDTTQTLAVLPSLADSAYFVTCTSSLTGCTFELSTTTEPTYYSNFSIEEASCGQATITPTLSISRGDIDNFFWNFGDTTTLADTANTPNPSYTYPGPGTYEVYLIADDGLGCYSDTLRDSVTIYFPPLVDFISDTICIYEEFEFVNTSDVSENVSNYFQWNFGDGSPIDTARNPFHEFPEDTLYFVTLTVWTDSMFCIDSITKPMLIHPQPNADFSWIEPDSCIPHEVHFVNESSFIDSSTIVLYEWDFDNDELSTTENPINVYTSPGLFTPSLVITDTFGCQDSTRFVDAIRVANIPEAIFEVDSIEMYITNPTLSFYNFSNDADSYIWYFGNSSDGYSTVTDENPVHTFSESGTFTITLNAISNYGCFDTANLSVTVIDDRLDVANIITPNGDGLNDGFFFNVDENSISNFSCQIYNRWGMLIYETTNPNFYWDGTVNGEFVSPGSYFYDIQYNGYESRPFYYRGGFTIVR